MNYYSVALLIILIILVFFYYHKKKYSQIIVGTIARIEYGKYGLEPDLIPYCSLVVKENKTGLTYRLTNQKAATTNSQYIPPRLFLKAKGAQLNQKCAFEYTWACNAHSRVTKFKFLN